MCVCECVPARLISQINYRSFMNVEKVPYSVIELNPPPPLHPLVVSMFIQVSMLLSVSFFSQCIFTHPSATSAPKPQRENRREPTFPVEIFSVGNQYYARNRLLSLERHRLVILDSIIFTFAFPITLAFFIILEEHLIFPMSLSFYFAI